MHELVADRFVAFGRTWIDVASGAPVRLRFVHAAQVSEEIIRNEQYAERARLRHPLMNVLVDYGVAGSGRMFEAYSIGEPLGVGGRAASELLRHAGRFLASRGLPLTAHASRHALREVVGAGTVRTPGVGFVGLTPGRPLGLILQPRAVLESLREALEIVSPGGTMSIEIAGGRGAGLRTARLFAARSARMAGLVPVASAVLVRLPSLRERLAGRHLCVLLDDHTSAERTTLATFLARMGTASARRHVLLRFTRTEAPHPGARLIDSMGIAAMTSMVFVDQDNGPSHEELFDAARGAAGRPGLFLERLRAAPLGEPPARLAVVHESSPAYVLGVPSSTRLRHGAGRVLRDAPDRGAAACGARQACLGGAPADARARACSRRAVNARSPRRVPANSPGYFAVAAKANLRSPSSSGRGRSPRDGAAEVGAVVGIGVVWTDQRRFREAEASLRGACAAAALIGDAGLKSRALARARPMPLLAVPVRRSGDRAIHTRDAVVERRRYGRSLGAAGAIAGGDGRPPSGARRRGRSGRRRRPARGSQGRRGGLPQHGHRSAPGRRRRASAVVERTPADSRLVRAPAARRTSRAVPARRRRAHPRPALSCRRARGALAGTSPVGAGAAARCLRCCDRKSRTYVCARTPIVARSTRARRTGRCVELEVMLEMAHAARRRERRARSGVPACVRALARCERPDCHRSSDPSSTDRARLPASAGRGRATRHSSPARCRRRRRRRIQRTAAGRRAHPVRARSRSRCCAAAGRWAR